MALFLDNNMCYLLGKAVFVDVRLDLHGAYSYVLKHRCTHATKLLHILCTNLHILSLETYNFFANVKPPLSLSFLVT